MRQRIGTRVEWLYPAHHESRCSGGSACCVCVPAAAACRRSRERGIRARGHRRATGVFLHKRMGLRELGRNELGQRRVVLDRYHHVLQHLRYVRALTQA